MFAGMRLLVGIGGALLFALGLLLLIGGAPGSFPLLIAGAVAIVAAVWERTRYRSLAAERGEAPPGPGGGEPPDAIDPRFKRTEEVFVDPTSGRVMRVYLDASTGERRYRAEG
jgi:hypothetical protein